MSDITRWYEEALCVASCAAPGFSFRGGQQFLHDQGRRLQPPLHPSGCHGYCLLWAGVYHLVGKETKERYVSLSSYKNNSV